MNKPLTRKQLLWGALISLLLCGLIAGPVGSLLLIASIVLTIAGIRSK